MSRTIIEIPCGDYKQTVILIEDVLNSHKYESVQKNDEYYWQQGMGVTQSPKFIKYYFEQDKLILEGWVLNFGKESDLSGVVGSLPKKSCKEVLDEIKEKVEQFNQQALINSSNNDYNQVDTFNNTVNNSNNQEENTTQTNNTSNHQVSKSNGIIPRRYRGSMIQNVFEIILAIFYLIGASSGYLVLRFTDSSEALMLVALIILIHGVLALISNIQDKQTVNNTHLNQQQNMNIPTTPQQNNQQEFGRNINHDMEFNNQNQVQNRFKNKKNLIIIGVVLLAIIVGAFLFLGTSPSIKITDVKHKSSYDVYGEVYNIPDNGAYIGTQFYDSKDKLITSDYRYITSSSEGREIFFGDTYSSNLTKVKVFLYDKENNILSDDVYYI